MHKLSGTWDICIAAKSAARQYNLLPPQNLLVYRLTACFTQLHTYRESTNEGLSTVEWVASVAMQPQYHLVYTKSPTTTCCMIQTVNVDSMRGIVDALSGLHFNLDMLYERRTLAVVSHMLASSYEQESKQRAINFGIIV
jgi:uncharacterized integral membrane protein